MHKVYQFTDNRHIDFTSKAKQLVKLYRDLVRPAFLECLQTAITIRLPEIGGHIRRPGISISILCYAKRDSKHLFQLMYYAEALPCLQRKYDPLS